MSRIIEIADVMDPYGGAGRREGKTLKLEYSLLQGLWDQQIYWKYYNQHTARTVLRSPQAIFMGLRTDTETSGLMPSPEEVDRGLCYVGQPPEMRNSENDSFALPLGFVFTAYVNPNGFLFDWRLEKADATRPYLPQIHDRHRFPGGLIWQNDN